MKRAVVALVAILLLAGCGSAEAEAGAATAAPPGVQPSPAGPSPAHPSAAGSSSPAAVPVPASLAFRGTTLDGRAFDAGTMAGKPAILWFWAPWCATCASQAQSIRSLPEEYGDRLNILGIAGMGDNKAMHEFVADLEVGVVPHLDDEAGRLWKRFKITEQSTYVLLDRTGKVVTTGYLDDLQLTEAVTKLVA